MAHVVDYEEFESLKGQVIALSKELTFIKAQMLNQQWLSRHQALKALGCSDSKLMQLVKAGKLSFRKEGKKPFYFADSIRDYLSGQKVDNLSVDNRLIAAFSGRD